MDRIDYRHNYREYYAPHASAPHWVELPRMNVLAVDGEGPVEAAAERLARLADTVRKVVRRRLHVDFAPMPVETLWHAGGGWTLLVMQPPFVYADAVAAAGGDGARFASFGEGRAAQCVGPLAERAAVAAGLRAWAEAAGAAPTGPLHVVPLVGERGVLRLALTAPDWSPPRAGYL